MLVATARHGAAVPALSIRAIGVCPTDHEIEAALVERGLRLGGANYTVDVQSETTGATLRLQHSVQGQVLERHIASHDCRALAEAIAVVVEAYFIDLRGPDVESSNRTAGNDDSQAGASTALAPSSHTDNLSGTPPPPSMAQSHQAGIMAWRQTPPAPGEPGLSSKPRQPMRFEGFVGVGPALTVPNAKFTPEVEVGVSAEVRSVPISTELALATTWPTISGGDLDRVRRWANQGVVRVGIPVIGVLLYRPWLGLGVSAASLRALDVPAAPTKTSMSSIVESGLEIAWPLGAAWRGRLDVGCSILMFRDTYRVDPDGEIGRGPRVVCATLIGVAIGSATVGRGLNR